MEGKLIYRFPLLVNVTVPFTVYTVLNKKKIDVINKVISSFGDFENEMSRQVTCIA